MKKRLHGLISLLVICGAAGFFLFFAYFREPEPAPVVIPHIGQIQVLNACGETGAAKIVSDFLRKKGYDVVEYGNNDKWYYKHTIIASRCRDMTIAGQVADALHTPRVLLLREEGTLLDATVFVGKDYKELLKNES